MAASCSSEEDADLLMRDPFLDYINQILMEEEGIDNEAAQQVDNTTSYQAMFSCFQDILAESSAGLHKDGFDSHRLHQHTDCCREIGPGEHRVEPGGRLSNEVPNTVRAPRVSLPPNAHPQGSLLQQEGPLITTSPQINELYGKKTGSRAENVVFDALIGRGGQQDQGNGNVDDEFYSRLAEVDLSFQDLNLDDVYTSLYVEKPTSSSQGGASDSKRNGGKKAASAGQDNKPHGKRKVGVPLCVDVREVLVSCAQAVAMGDARGANEILQELYEVHGAAANGTAMQRIALFFGNALAARMRGKVQHEFGAMEANQPSAGMVLRASKLGFEVSPYEKILHYFANQSILKAAEGKSRLHIVDFGFMYGMQWPCLMNALAERCNGPGAPLLVITGIQFEHPCFDMGERLDRSGRQLAVYAKAHDIPFQYHSIVTSKWADLDAASLHCHDGEVLVVNCKGLCHLAGEDANSASTVSPRQKFFTCVRNLNPHLLVTTVVNASHNSPFFVSRFSEALYFFSNVFDMLETVWGDSPQRLIVERSGFYRDIVNIVACEGAERVDIPETYKQWHARIAKAGFEHMPILPNVLERAKAHVKQHYHKDFLILGDAANGLMLMGWKGRTTLATSAWKPSSTKEKAIGSARLGL